MHEAAYLKDHPDARPIGTDGQVIAAARWLAGCLPHASGVSPGAHGGLPQHSWAAPIDGVWLDYHHAHASWEQARPNLPDTCFCDRCLSMFQQQTRVSLPDEPDRRPRPTDPGAAQAAWVQWRCDVFTDWVREFREIIDRERPGALLGTFHCPWSESDHDGAIRDNWPSI